MNTSIWDNEKIVGLTGYSIVKLAKPLYELSLFIKQNLSPDRLEGFDIDNLKHITQGQSAQI